MRGLNIFQEANASCSRSGKNIRWRLTAVAAVVAAGLTVPVRAVGQERLDPMAATVAKWFAMIERSFVGLADAMPAEETRSSRPTVSSRTSGH